MRKIIIIMAIFCGFIVSTVNADDQTLTKEQIEEKFNLPPEPDPELNNATIEGIDSNNNDIRDDWERAIAFEHYKNPTMMNINNLKAQNYTALNRSYKSRNIHDYETLDSEATNLISCSYFYGNGLGSNDLKEMGSNTYERFVYILKRDAEISKIIGYGIEGLSLSEKQKICPKYKK